MSLKTFVLSAIREVMEDKLGFATSTNQHPSTKEECHHGTVEQKLYPASGSEPRYANFDLSQYISNTVYAESGTQQQVMYANQSNDVYSQEGSHEYMMQTTRIYPSLEPYIVNNDRYVNSQSQQLQSNRGQWAETTYHVQQLPQQTLYEQSPGTPSIRPVPNFNAVHDAEMLHDIMTERDKSKSVSFLCGRTNWQRQEIAKAYRAMYAKDLIEELSELNQGSKAIILALLEPVAVYDAKQLHKAMVGSSSQDSVLIECMTYMTSRSNQQLAEICRMYRQLYHKDIREDLLHDKQAGLQQHLAFLCTSGYGGEANSKAANAHRTSSGNTLATSHVGETTMMVIGEAERKIQHNQNEQALTSNDANISTSLSLLCKATELSDVTKAHVSNIDARTDGQIDATMNNNEQTSTSSTIGQLEAKMTQITGKSHLGSDSRGDCQLETKTTQVINENRTKADSRSSGHIDMKKAHITNERDGRDLYVTGYQEVMSTQIGESSFSSKSGHVDVTENRISGERHTETNSSTSGQLEINTTQITDESHVGADSHSTGYIDMKTAQITGERDGKDLHVIDYQQMRSTEMIGESQFSSKSDYLETKNQISAESQTTNSSSNSQQIQTTQTAGKSHSGADSSSTGHIDMKTAQITGERDGRELHVIGYQEKSTQMIGESQFSKSDYVDVTENRSSDEIHTEMNSRSSSGQLEIRTTQIIDECMGAGSSSNGHIGLGTARIAVETRGGENLPVTSYQEMYFTQIVDDSQFSGGSGYVDVEENRIFGESHTERDSSSSSSGQLDIKTTQSQSEKSSNSGQVENKESRTGTDSRSSGFNIETTQITGESHTGADSRSTGHLEVKTAQITGERDGRELHVTGYQEMKCTQTIGESQFMNESGYLGVRKNQISGERYTETIPSSSDQLEIKMTKITDGSQTGNLHSSDQFENQTTQLTGESHRKDSRSTGHADAQTTGKRDGNDFVTSYVEMKSTQIIDDSQFSSRTGHVDVEENRISGESHKEGNSSSSSGVDIRTTQIIRESMGADSHSTGHIDLGTAQIAVETRDDKDSHVTGYQEKKSKQIIGESQFSSKSGYLETKNQISAESRTETSSSSGGQLEVHGTQDHSETSSSSGGQLENRTTQTTSESHMGADSRSIGQVDMKTAHIAGETRNEKELHVISYQEMEVTQMMGESQSRKSGYLDVTENSVSGESPMETNSSSSGQLESTTQTAGESYMGTDDHRSSAQFKIETMQITGESYTGADSRSTDHIGMKTAQITGEGDGRELHVTGYHEMKSTQMIGERQLNNKSDYLNVTQNQTSDERHTETIPSSSDQLEIKTTKITGESHRKDSRSSTQLEIKTTQITDESSIGSASRSSDHFEMQTAQITVESHMCPVAQITGATRDGKESLVTGHIVDETKFNSKGAYVHATNQLSSNLHMETNWGSDGQPDIRTMQISGASHTGGDLRSSIQLETLVSSSREQASGMNRLMESGGNARDNIKRPLCEESVSSGYSYKKMLYSYEKTSLATDDNFFDQLLGNRDLGQLRKVFDDYQKETKQPVEAAIQSQFSGYVRDGLLATVDVVRNRPAYFAKLLHQTLESHGTRDEDLLRLIVSRSEYDMFDIRRQFYEMYHTSLESMIKTNCSFVYRDTLIALVNGNGL